MTFPHFMGAAFRLVRTLDVVLDQGTRKLAVRVELFQDPAQATHFRYRVFGLESFRLRADYHNEALAHEVLTALCLPNLGAGDYFEAADVDAAEKRFYEDFEREFAKTRRG